MSTHLHFIPNTHLDREWTLDFQHTRKMTVDFLNTLLEIMDRIPDYCFLLDSQAVPLEDYLEIMPENRQRLKKLISAGRIDAGPWYSALDMNCLDGESILRNMLWGHLTVEPFGPVMKVGYTPFGWGQVTQLPQIYRGFGIDVAYFYRGITAKEAPHSEFVWEGADGSELLTSRFGTGARYNFYFDVWRKAFYSNMPHRIQRRLEWTEAQVPFKLCNEDNRYDHGYIFPTNLPIQHDIVKKCFRDLIEREREHFSTPEIAFMHGMDTSTPDIREDAIFKECQDYLKEGETFFYSSLVRYSQDLKKACEGKDLPRIKGEARHIQMSEYGYSPVANDIISARARQKTFMTRVESNLVRHAEPFAALASFLGAEWPEKLFAVAWKQFLKCHPHDTIGGCGIDRIEEDTMYRLRDVESVCNVVSCEALMHVQSQIDTSSLSEDGIVLTVFNPSPYARTETVEAYVDIPRELGFKAYGLADSTGKPVTFALTNTGHRDKVFRDHTDLALTSYADEYKVHFLAENTPGFGYKTYFLKAGTQAASTTPAADNDVALENEFLKAKVNADGTVDLLDKASGQTYAGINYFQDDGELGHSWSQVRPLKDLVISSRGTKAVRQVIAETPALTAVRATVNMKIPFTTPHIEANYIDWRQSERTANDLRDLAVTVDYSLSPGDRSLGVHLTFDNQCTNHRLRVCFPTGTKATESYAESPFDLVKRAVRRDANNPYAHFPQLTYPMIRFAGAEGNGRNFAFITGGQKEYEVLEDEESTFAVTLFRAYNNRLCTSGGNDWERRPGELAQSIGRHEINYRLYPSATGPAYSSVFRAADRLHAPLVVAETKRRPGTLPMDAGFLSIEDPRLIMSAIKKASRVSGMVLRVFNPSEETIETSVRLAKPVRKVRYVNLNEEPTGEKLTVKRSAIHLSVAPKKIVSIHFLLK